MVRSLVEWVLLFWSTFVGSQAPLPVTFAIVIFFISGTEHHGSASNQVFEKRRLQPPLPCFYPHSEWARLGPVQLRSITNVTNLGLLGAAICSAVFIDRVSLSSHPN